MFKATAALFRLLFLSILLFGNVLGFHYYFTPVACNNLKYIPANATLVMTINLKSISGTLLSELIFTPSSFEKDVISTSEEELFSTNQSVGINPFGLVSLFRFNFNQQTLNGASLNLENEDKFQSEFENRDYHLEQIDDVKVFSNERITAFLFNKVVVFIFSPLGIEDQEKLASEFLLNENSSNASFKNGHFTLFAKKGLLENTPMASYFRLMPDFMESIFISGEFNIGTIKLNGKIETTNKEDWKENLTFSKYQPAKRNSLEFGFIGSEFSASIKRFLNQKFVHPNDTSLSSKPKMELRKSFDALSLSMQDFVLPIDLNIINAIMGGGVLPQPEYKIQVDLNSKEVEKVMLNYNFPLSLIENNDLKRTVFAQITDQKLNNNSAYFYFNPVKFIEEAEINILVKSLMDPFLIFSELKLEATRFEKNNLYFEGDFSFSEKDIHSLVQMRLLFKDISAIL